MLSVFSVGRGALLGLAFPVLVANVYLKDITQKKHSMLRSTCCMPIPTPCRARLPA